MGLTLTLAGFTSASLVLGFLSQLYLVAHVGAGSTTDAFFAALTLPLLVLAVISGSLTNVLVPLFVGHADERASPAWGFFGLAGLVFGGLALVLGASAPLWVRLLFPGFDDEALGLTVVLTRIHLVGMVFTALYAVELASCHARGRFVWPDLTSPLGGVLSLALLVWGLDRYGIEFAAWAYVLRFALPTLLLLPQLGSFRTSSLSRDLVATAWARVKPLLLATSYYKSGVVVDRFFASLAPAGGLSLLNLAQQLHAGIFQVVANAVVNPMVPRLVAAERVGSNETFQTIYRSRLKWVVAGTTAIVVAAAVVGRPVIEFVFGPGETTTDQQQLLYLLFIALAGYLIGGGSGQVLAATFYATGDTKFPAKVGVVGFTLSVLLKLIGFWLFGLVGVAVAASVHQVFNSVWLDLGLRRKGKSRALEVAPG